MRALPVHHDKKQSQLPMRFQNTPSANSTIFAYLDNHGTMQLYTVSRHTSLTISNCYDKYASIIDSKNSHILPKTIR